VAQATGDGNYERANQLITTGSAAMLILSIVFLSPVAIFSKSLAKMAGVPPEFVSSTASAFTILALIMILSNFAAVFEAIVSGCHRLDLVRKFYIGAALFEAISIVICMYSHLGILAMTITMVISEVGLIVCCYLSASRLLPQVHIGLRYLSTGVVPELIRFAGSYQLVNVMEILYSSILPFGILRLFGARASGVYAICTRMSGAANSIQEASLLPLLSGGTMIYASQAKEQIQVMIKKTFKWTLVVTLCPLGFVAVYGPTLIMAWTRQTDPMIRTGLWFLCIASAFSAISRTGLILYRARGGALMDVLRQILTISVLLITILIGRRIGYFGMLGGLAIAEMIGAAFMLQALKKTVDDFHPLVLLPDAAKVIMAILVVLVASMLTTVIPIPWNAGQQPMAWFRLGLAGAACAMMAWPAMAITKCLSGEEQQAILDIFFPNRKKMMVEPNSAD
jgi:O-antigen/teichoic acid export membrane protein